MKKQGSYRNRKTKEKKPFPWRRLLIVIGLFLPVLGIYQYFLRFRLWFWIMPIYYGIAAVLFLAYFFLNGGLTSKLPAKKDLPDTWTNAEKEAYLETLTRRKATARKVLYLLVPFILTIFVDALMYVLWEREGAPFHPASAKVTETVCNAVTKWL